MKKILLILAIFIAIAITRPLWKPFAYKWKWSVVASNVLNDTLRRTGLVTGQIGQRASLRASDAAIEREISRSNDMFQGYLDHAGCAPSKLRGTRVIEIGPGFSIGVPLRFLAAGSIQAVAIDKFVPFQDSEFSRKLYLDLRKTLSDTEKKNFDAAIQIDGSIRLNTDRLQYIYGKTLAETAPQLTSHAFDFIVSNAVIEEIYDPDPVFAAMDQLLCPGGYLIHNIDLSDYGMFAKYGFHPLEFLTIPDSIYRYMVESSGQPNRKLVNYYREKMDQLRYSHKIYINRLLGVDKELTPSKTRVLYGVDYSDDTLALIRRIRPRLATRYRNLPDEDLMVRSITLVAQKPAK